MPLSLPSFCLEGLDTKHVDIEVDVSPGMPHFSMIGMASTCIKESIDRIRAAIKHSDFEFPMTRKTVNLAPADLAKRGSHYDLPIAIGLLAVSGQLSSECNLSKDVFLLGELGLDGRLKMTRGMVPALIHARKMGYETVILPRGLGWMRKLFKDVNWVELSSLKQVVAMLEGRVDEGLIDEELEDDETQILGAGALSAAQFEEANRSAYDFKDMQGNEAAKRALMIAAAGGHHLLMSGPPGCGKSQLAKCFPTLLPELSADELLDVMQIYSVSGIHRQHRPFRSVQHHASPFTLIGGGSQLVPGEVSLAHHGVLFLDELPEFSRQSLEVLREPLEEGEVHLKRGRKSCVFPSRFQLIAAMNPCPCGFYGDPAKECHCSPHQVKKYQGKISGPILDRIDLLISVNRVSFEVMQYGEGLSSEVMHARVLKAREIQLERWVGRGFSLNRDMRPGDVNAEFLDVQVESLLRRFADKHHFSPRVIHKTIKLARTIADLEGARHIGQAHMVEALHYRV